MRLISKNRIKIALILLLSLIGSGSADVKLRIYLKDGTLQAGNLVVENKDVFVILGKDGRTEIPKDKIMFINGKTLKQWEDRPDKLFQTEILPSEIPNPAYVNDKAALPPAPVIDPVKPLQAAKPQPSPEPKKVEEAKSTTPKLAAAEPLPNTISANGPAAEPASSAAAPPAVAPIVAEAKNEGIVKEPKETKITSAVASKKRSKKSRVQPAPAEPAVSEPTDAPSTPAVLAAVPQNISKPSRFQRDGMGDYHWKRAQSYLEAGQKGQSLQELHLAALLSPRNEQVPLLMGKLYYEDGVYEKAKRYLSYPPLRKNEDAKTILAAIETNVKKAEQQKWILYGSAGFGSLAWIPLLIVKRRLFRAPKPPVVISADELEGAVEADERIEKIVEEIAPLSLKQEVETAEISEKPAWVPSPEPASPIPQPIQTPFEVVESAMPMPPVLMPLFDKGPVREPEMPPPAAPEPTKVTPEVYVPPKAVQYDPEEVLRIGARVDAALQDGNLLASEGKMNESRRAYRTALALNPACLEAQLGLGFVCFMQGQLDVALEHYMRALIVDPRSAAAHYGIGRVLLETDQADQAMREFESALNIDPNFDEARETLSSLGKAA